MASRVLSETSSGSSHASRFQQQAERLSLLPHDTSSNESTSKAATQAIFITPQDPIIQTADGNRLPGVPPEEAYKLNELRIEDHSANASSSTFRRQDRSRSTGGNGSDSPGTAGPSSATSSPLSGSAEAPLGVASPPSRTNPLFPPLPLYGPASLMRKIQCATFRVSSFFLSLGFLGVIVLGSAFTSIPLMIRHIFLRLTFRDPDARRPFYEEEKRRRKQRKDEQRAWKRNKRRRRRSAVKADELDEEASGANQFEPTEGGKDPLICDAAYYARRVGLDIEEFKVQTEDGFIITLWHVYNPKEYVPRSAAERTYRSPNIFSDENLSHVPTQSGPNRPQESKRKYPVLMVHGLLQSAGAYCCNDDDSLAFFLCKSGYDVWLGNNRCGFKPEHTLLHYADPRMWAWNIRQMGVLDLPAFISRVLSETGFEKLGLICHSQGTTETFVALAKEQRPDLGNKISVFCALAPAVYAGPLIGKMYFKLMRVISPAMFRIFFGIHAFIPFMMTMHGLLPGKLYGALGYRVFSFLFNWTDDRWDQGIRDRFFQFAPVYVSAESMRWWLGRECFARHKCILATKEEGRQEDEEDEVVDYINRSEQDLDMKNLDFNTRQRGSTAWYDEQAPPFAMWIGGSDELVDGRRLLKRFERGREPHVRLVHAKVIEEYEHLDVIWALDSIDKVGKEIREVLWKTAAGNDRAVCRVPAGCEEVDFGE